MGHYTFYTVDNEGRKCIFNKRECKFPMLTKDWDELRKHLDKPHIAEVGYIQHFYQVTSDINDDVDIFESNEEALEHIQQELSFHNVYEKKEPWTEGDFYITKIN